MARYQAECYFGTRVGSQKMEVNAATPTGAVEMLKNVYGAKTVANVREVRTNNNNSSSGSGSFSGVGSLAIVALIAAVFFAPWVLMTVGGIAGTWIAQKICGSTIEEAMDNEDIKRFWIIFLIATLSRGAVFVKGTELHNYLNYPDVKVEQKTQK